MVLCLINLVAQSSGIPSSLSAKRRVGEAPCRRSAVSAKCVGEAPCRRIVHNPVRGHTYKIVKNSFRLDVRKNFFSNRVVNAWNKLPQYVIDAETVNSFKARLDKFYHTI